MPFIVNEDMFVGVPIDGEVDRAKKLEDCFLKLKSDYAYMLFLFLSFYLSRNICANEFSLWILSMQAGMLAERYPKYCFYILLFPGIFKVSRILSSG